MKSPIRKAMHHPIEGSAIFEVGDEIPEGWYDSPADFHNEPEKEVEPEPAKRGWPKGKARK